MPNLTTKDACRAARKGDILTLKKCIDAGVNFNATAEFFESGWFGTSFFADKKEGSSKPMELLGPCTPLMVAATYGYFDIVKTIIENVPNLDINYRGGRLKDHTALDCAAKWSDDKALFNYLRDHGATSGNPPGLAKFYELLLNIASPSVIADFAIKGIPAALAFKK